MENSVQLQRSIWMATLAQAPLGLLEQRISQLKNLPDYRFLRPPEVGLAMVRGRAGGRGQAFNLGEMTLTRCVVKILLPESEPLSGFGYVAGRSQRHAELAALCDGLLQHPDWRSRVYTQVIEPLQTAAQQRRETQAAQTESTRVNFFTLLRGEG